MNRFFVFVLILLAFFLIGCKPSNRAISSEVAASESVVIISDGSETEPVMPVQEDPNLPPWLNEIAPDGVIWGVGSARMSSVSMSMTTAESRARTEAARQLNAFIHGSASDVFSIDVSGSRTIDRWQAPDGTWWYRVEIDKE